MGIISKPTKARNTSTPHDIFDYIQISNRPEDIAGFLPEKQDVATIRDKNRKWKEHKQILTITIAEVNQLLKNEHPDVTIGKSRFSSLCPIDLKLSSALPRNVCNCIYHSDVNLALETLNSNIPDIFFITIPDQLVKDCVCEIIGKTCMPSNCDLSKEKFDHKFIGCLLVIV